MRTSVNTKDIIVGIDLGTTNSSVGYVENGRPCLIPIDGSVLLPSVVGLAPDGTLLVGTAARNQRHVFPLRTVASIKRRMGQTEKVRLGDTEYSPTEISALILRRLKIAAEQHLGGPVTRAVITVPAFFSDAQRTATREAGEMAGFKVERILNEPTAAALCYAEAEGPARTLLVYDLGGGTFDVSIVRTRGEITEVLASHGDTLLGGDDFDRLILTELRQRFAAAGAIDSGDLDSNARAIARLNRAAEAAKIGLSSLTHVQVTEEHLALQGDMPIHLDTELDRPTYESLIDALLHRTLDSAQIALREAKVLARDLDDAILVGGSTRTPAVSALLHELLGRAPRCEIDPDQAVALGAAIQAARIGGQATSRILVDVTPYSFGTSHFGYLDGMPSPDCYAVIIRRNSPLPARQSQVFYTMRPGQEATEVRVFQGESPDALDNLHLGGFMMEGLDPKAGDASPLVFALSLDLNGILHVEVTEKHTGLRREITLENAFRTLDAAEMATARQRIASAMMGPGNDGGEGDEWDDDDDPEAFTPPDPPADLPEADRGAWATAISLLEKADRLRPDLEQADRVEVEDVCTALLSALDDAALGDVRSQSAILADILFYLE